MYVCMYTCIYVCVHVRIHMRMCIWNHICIHTHSYMDIRIVMHGWVYTHLYTWVHTCLHIYAYTHFYMHVHSSPCIVFSEPGLQAICWQRCGPGRGQHRLAYAQPKPAGCDLRFCPSVFMGPKDHNKRRILRAGSEGQGQEHALWDPYVYVVFLRAMVQNP